MCPSEMSLFTSIKRGYKLSILEKDASNPYAQKLKQILGSWRADLGQFLV